MNFIFILGKFVIGLFSPINWVIYIRLKDKNWEFRSTDLTKLKYQILPKEGKVSLTAVSLFQRYKLEINILSNFSNENSPPIYIPTPVGFSNNPGCKETYTANAQVKILEYNIQSASYEEQFNHVFTLSALEFGGSFLNSKHSNL